MRIYKLKELNILKIYLYEQEKEKISFIIKNKSFAQYQQTIFK